MNERKNYKKYCNDNYIRFNLDHEQIWKKFDLEFGDKRTDELSRLFKERYENPEKNLNPYKFCKNFKETSVLMYFQSDFFLLQSEGIGDPRRLLDTLGLSSGSEDAEGRRGSWFLLEQERTQGLK